MLPPMEQPAAITNSAGNPSQTQAAVTATASGKAVCPLSGIPPVPIVSPVAQIEMYPKMVQGVVFPS
jgi:hypothetical protein